MRERGRKLMWIRQVFLTFVGISAGVTVAAGIFGLVTGLGVVSDLADRTHTGKAVVFYEDCMTVGGILGNLVLLYEPRFFCPPFLLILVGGLGGIFTGCLIMSLTETINVFPIFLRRSKIVQGAAYLVLALALGKTMGSLLQFINGW